MDRLLYILLYTLQPLTPKKNESQGSSPQINLLMKDIIALCNRDKEENGIDND